MAKSKDNLLNFDSKVDDRLPNCTKETPEMIEEMINELIDKDCL